MEEEIKLPFNSEMSAKYGLTIYNAENHQFPYFVQEWGECFTEEEIQQYLPDHQMIEGIQFEND